MKRFKKLLQLLVFVMVWSFLTPTVTPFSNTYTAEAATVKINKKTLTLEVGKTATLKISGTTAKVTWSSSNKAVATVNSKGKVTAKKAGKATITATVNKKKYTCSVTVKKAAKQEVSFSTQTTKMGNFQFEYPKDWTNTILLEDKGQILSVLYPSNSELSNDGSGMAIFIIETGAPKPEASEVKELINNPEFQEYLAETFGFAFDVVSKPTITEFKAKSGTALKVEFTTGDSVTIKQCAYVLYFDNYVFAVNIAETGNSEKLKLREIAEYIVNSVKVVK